MASEQELSAIVRAALAGKDTVREVKMFGGIGFMLNGNMIVAASRRGLMVRVGKDRQGEALAARNATHADERQDHGGLRLCRSPGCQ